MRLLFTIFFYSVTFSQVSAQIDKSQFNDEKILKSLYVGIYSVNNKNIKWKPLKKELKLVSKDGFCYTNIDTIFNIKIDSSIFAVVLTRTIDYDNGIPNDCAGCSPEIGMSLFIKNEKTWKLLVNKKRIGQIGQAGYLPSEKKIIKTGPNEWALLLVEDAFWDESNAHLFSINIEDFSKKILEFKHFSRFGENDNGIIYREINLKIKEENTSRKYYDLNFEIIDSGDHNGNSIELNHEFKTYTFREVNELIKTNINWIEIIK
jgi:hypothetical protein